MNNTTKKWVFLKASSIILIPLMGWFIFNLVSLYDKEYFEVLKFYSSQPSKFLVSVLLIFAFFYSSLSISEIFEDYVRDKSIKSFANRLLNFFAITIPLITVIILFNL